MARTLHMELTPSRRSKRLLNNGYYVQPPGETAQFLDVSSEDDDNASIHSNSSSVLSERAVHYERHSASPTKRRRQKKRNTKNPSVAIAIEKSGRSYRRRAMERNFAAGESLAGSTRSTPVMSSSDVTSVRSYSASTTRVQSRREIFATTNGVTGISQTQASYDALSSGDRISMKGSENAESEEYSTRNEDVSITEKEVHHQRKPPDRERENNFSSFTVPSIVSIVQSYIVSWIVRCVYNFCKTVYLIALTVFSWEVWSLTWRIGDLPLKVLRYLLFLFLLVTSSHLAARHFIGDKYVAITYQTLAHGWKGFGSSFPKEDPVLIDSKTKEFAASSTQDFEDVLSKIELGFALKLAEVKDSLTELRSDLHKSDVHLQKINSAQDQTAAHISTIETRMKSLRGEHDTKMTKLQEDVQKLRQTFHESSQQFVLKTDFKNQMISLGDRLTSLNQLIDRSIRNYDRHVGNSTYIKQIANLQFVENFLNILDQAKAPVEDKNGLHSIFMSWLGQQGYAKIEDIKSDMKVLHENFASKLERIRQGVRRHSSTITLEKIVERPLIETQQTMNSDTEKEIKKWIRDALAVYSADRIALADHALETAGGAIVSTRCSESYDRKTSLISLLGIPIYYNINTPRSVIQAGTLPGECWSFKGSEGYVVVALSGFVRPSSFSLEHIPKELSPVGRIDSAPKDFSVLGLADVSDYKGVLLGKFRYDQDGPIIQQFPKMVENEKYFAFVELRITSNWGNPDYTCVYRFRVHGERKGAEVPTL